MPGVVVAAIAVTAGILAGIHFFKWNVLKAVAAINTWASAGSTGTSSIPVFPPEFRLYAGAQAVIAGFYGGNFIRAATGSRESVRRGILSKSWRSKKQRN
jgi:hypothetical protein